MLESQLAAAKAAGPTLSSPAANPAAGQLDTDANSEADLDNPAVTLKCLRLVVATLQDPSISQLNNTLLTLLEEFITISVQSEIPAIRKEAILALSCCCLRSLESARQHMLLLLQAAHIDLHEVRIAAITTVPGALLHKCSFGSVLWVLHLCHSILCVHKKFLDLRGVPQLLH